VQFKGAARFVSPHEVVLESPGAPPQSIKAKNFLIATGSTPRKHRTIVADGVNILTSDHIHKLKTYVSPVKSIHEKSTISCVVCHEAW